LCRRRRATGDGARLLAKVNPALGIFTLVVAVPVGALFTSSVFINVSSTAAMSVAAGAIMMDFSVGQRMEAPAVAANAWLDKSPTSAGAGHKAEHTDLLRNSIEGD
jgi:hypothetical protein